jgi:hypothetical protein
VIAVVILTVSLGGLAILAGRQWASSRDVDVRGRIENAVASDLDWLKIYGKYWRMTSGPYNLTCTQAGFGANCTPFILSATSTEYDPDPIRCATATGVAEDFVTAAAAVAITPSRPFAVAVGDTTLLSSTADTGQPALPPGTSLIRTITLGKNLIYLSYRFSGANAAPYNFVREVSVRPEAATWCP